MSNEKKTLEEEITDLIKKATDDKWTIQGFKDQLVPALANFIRDREGWISVTDRLPTAGDTCEELWDEVLTIQHGRKRPTMMKFWEIKNCPFTHHWKPLPQPPTQ